MPAKKKNNNFNLLNSKVFLFAFFPAFLVVATSMILMGLDSINTFSTEAASKKTINITRMPSADGYYSEWSTFDSTASSTTPDTSAAHYTFIDEFTCNGTDYVFSTSTTPKNTDSYAISLGDIPNGSKIEKISIRPCTATVNTVNAYSPDDPSGYYTTSSISFFYRYNGVDSAGKSYKVINNGFLTPSPAIIPWNDVGLIKNASSALEIGILHLGGSAGLKVSNLRTTIYYNIAPDTTPPTISNIQGSNITGTGANISWVTNEESIHIVYYGLTSSYGMSATAASSTSPSINLSGLISDTTYHFKVGSTDGSGNVSESDDKTFTTTGRAKMFAISDNFYSIASETQKQQFASRVDFIWSGDYFPGDWKTYNPNLTLGLYMPLNAFDTGKLPRCKTNSDCFNSVTGYSCIKPRSNNRYFQWWMDGEGVCWSATGWGSCATDQDCAIAGLNFINGRPYPGSCDTTSHKCRYSVQQQRAIEHNYWMANYHPEWILYRCATDGTPLTRGQHPDNVAWHSGAPQIPVDFTNDSVRADYKRRLSSLYSRNPNRYSVVSIDVVHPTNATRACGVYDAGGTFRQIFEGNSKFDAVACNDYYGFCDRNYIDQLYSWLSDLNSFAAESLNSKIFANLVNHSGVDWDAVVVQPVPADNPILKTHIYSVVDGVLDESGFTHNMSRQGTVSGKPSTWTYKHNSDADQMWAKQKGYVELANSLGINYYNKNGVYQLYDLDTDGKKQASEWALASYLISNQNTARLYFCSNPDGWLLNNALNWPQLDVDYGRPCEPAQQTTPNPLVYTRTYNRAFVVAHTGDSSSSAHTMSLPAGNFYTWNSAEGAYTDAVGSPTSTIEYQQGRIFYSPTDLCPLNFD